MSFLFKARVFKRGKRIDPRARLRGRVTDNEFRSFVDSCLKANKSPGPELLISDPFIKFLLHNHSINIK